jgi:hypothetical protein
MEYIIGIVVSLLAQWLKNSAKTNTAGTYLIVLALSVIAAGIYVFFKDTSIWPLNVEIATVAGVFYAYVIKRFENLHALAGDGAYLDQ